ncbi:MAG: polysaccharide biosynthesis/export family protein [Byssovorax sp.]
MVYAARATTARRANLREITVKKVVPALLLLLGSLTQSACGPSIYETYAYGKEYDPRKHEYVIGVTDIISIQVYKSADLSLGGAIVRPDGVVTIPLVGDVVVAGKTPSQVREDLKKRFSEFVKEATVNVTVSGFNSYRFIVSGQVNKSGSFSQKYYVSVSEAVAMAGGPNKFAGDQIVIYRADKDGHIREIPVSFKMIMSGKRPDMDVAIVAGDSVVVQ